MEPLKFAGKLDAYRRLYHLTIAELARKCEVDGDTMERLLGGQNVPNAVNLLRIENATGIRFEVADFEERGLWR